jgi:gliding motility-associated-like protein
MIKKLIILIFSIFVLTNNAKSIDVDFNDITIYLNASGVAVIDNSFINNGSSDNSSIYSISIDKETFSYESIGENWVTITVTDINGDVDYSTSIVTVIDTLKPVVNCKNATVYLNSNGIAVVNSSLINNGSSDNSSIYSMSIDKDRFDYKSIGENWVTITVTDVNGNVDYCTSIITVIDTLKPVTNCKGNSVQTNPIADFSIDYEPNSMRISINDRSQFGTGHTYKLGDGSSTDLISLNHLYKDAGTYTVWQFVSNEMGCIDSISKVINVHRTAIYVPTAFTPNNDGVNDVFMPIIPVNNTNNYEFTVYSIRGEMIFRTNSNSEGWNGSFKGIEVPSGDYLWTLTTNSKVGINVQSQKGYVKLIR